ncbi:MAG: hypothetical protein V3R48_06560, partial [Thermoplasmata archaeon]
SSGGYWDAGPISPGGAGTTPVVTVTHEANRDYRMSVWFTTDLISGPNTIDITNVNITAAGDPADDITADISFTGLGFANREFIWGTVTNQAHHVSANQETTGVQFRVNVPLATPVGSYVAALTIRVETP